MRSVIIPSSPVKSSSDIVPCSPEKSSTDVPSSPLRSSQMPPDDSLLSPLSQLASSTSTLSINVGGDTVHLTKAQVHALSTVSDVIMEDDDLHLCEPLPEDDTLAVNETKENENSVETPVKYFPIFNSNFSHQKLVSLYCIVFFMVSICSSKTYLPPFFLFFCFQNTTISKFNAKT